jgi:putative endonuclease
MPYFVYILASGRNGTLYVGVTNDLVRRVYEHGNDLVPGFTSQYSVHHLVYYETYDEIRDAIVRHDQDWHDLWPSLAADGG